MLFCGNIAEKSPDMPGGDTVDVLRPAFVFGIPQEAAQVIGVELDGAGAFCLSLLGEDEGAGQGPEGHPRGQYLGG